MKLKYLLIHLVFFYVSIQIDAYIEQRTFRECTKIYCRELLFIFFVVKQEKKNPEVLICFYYFFDRIE